MVLASGHLHVSETWLVFEEAQRRGVKRLVFTHPEDIVDASLNDVKGIAAMGAFVEHSLCMFLDGCKFKSCEAEDLRKQIEAGGVEQTILASDLGQVGTYSPLDGMRRGIRDVHGPRLRRRADPQDGVDQRRARDGHRGGRRRGPRRLGFGTGEELTNRRPRAAGLEDWKCREIVHVRRQ